MPTLAQRLEAVIPVTKSSETTMVLSTKTAEEVLAELGSGDLYDRFRKVVPVVKSSVAMTAFSSSLGKELVAAVNEA